MKVLTKVVIVKENNQTKKKTRIELPFSVK